MEFIWGGNIFSEILTWNVILEGVNISFQKFHSPPPENQLVRP